MPELNFTDLSSEKLSLPLFIEKEISVDVLRLDRIHPYISGNKWFKLRYYLEEAKKAGKTSIVTYGGAWSNHLLATAAACKMNDLDSVGIIRGEKSGTLSPILLKAKELGMRFVFISREEYRRKIIPHALNTDEHFLVDEGGYGYPGAKGAATILEYCQKETYTHIGCAAGTGTTMAGLISNASPSTRVMGISVLKNNVELEEKVKALLPDSKWNYQFIHDYHFGGYAKYKPELIEFMNEFYRQTNIPTDFVYTGKLFFAVMDLIRDNFFNPYAKLLIVHSGGLHGNTSLSKGTLIF